VIDLPLHYVLAWFPMVVVALLVGAVRDRTWGRRLEPAASRRVTASVAGALLGLYVAALVHWMPFASSRQALVAGGVWVAITAALDATLRALAPAPPTPPAEVDDLFAPPRSRRAWSGAVLLVWIGVAPWLFDTLQRRP
jgi:MFS family permease